MAENSNSRGVQIRATTLISALQAMVREHGDRSVCVWDDDTGEALPLFIGDSWLVVGGTTEQEGKLLFLVKGAGWSDSLGQAREIRSRGETS